MSDTFWLNNPLILVDKKHITEIFPIGKLLPPNQIQKVLEIVALLAVAQVKLTGHPTSTIFSRRS